MKTRFAMIVVALLLTFILSPSAEAKFAPHAAPGLFLDVNYETSAPLEELECNEHHDQEIIAEALAEFGKHKAGYANLAPGFVQQSVYFSFRHPPRT